MIRFRGLILLAVALTLLIAAIFSWLKTGSIWSMLWHAGVGLSVLACWLLSRRADRNFQRIINSQQSIQSEKSTLLELALSSAVHSGDIQSAARRISELSAQTLGVERVSVWLFDSSQSKISCVDLYLRTLDVHQTYPEILRSDCPVYFDAIRCNRVIAISDTSVDPLTKDFAYIKQLGIGAMVDAPFHTSGQLAGIVCHEHVGANRIWTIDEQNFAASIADMMSRALQESQKVRAESELKKRSKAIEASMDGVAILDSNECFVYLNEAHAQIYGYQSSNELIGKSWRILYSGDELRRFEQEYMPQFNATGTLRIEAEGVKKNGTLFPQRISLSKLDDGGLVCVCQDITEEKKLQAQLMQAHKMEAVGQLAGGIAHDFNNLLTGIMGYTGLIKLRCKEDTETFKNAELIESTASKASQLTFKLLGFARKGKHKHSLVDIHDVINDTFPLLTRTIEKNINLSKSLEAKHSLIMGDSVQIQQVLINLAINARDAMNPELSGVNGGNLIICTECVTFGPANIAPDPNLTAGKYLQLTVRDSGCGIDANIQDKIFEPFFTTKPPGKGSGLGLAMVYGIVRNHGGAICLESSLGQGTTFKVYLPISERPLASQLEKVAEQKPASPLALGRGHILLVDDHSVIRDAGSKMLATLGYTVVTAKDGIEALDYLKDNSAEVDLVLIDMVMPRMGARECIKEIKLIRPDLKIILATGYVNNHLVQEILDQGVSAFVQKPFRLESIASTISGLLKAPTPLAAAAATVTKQAH